MNEREALEKIKTAFKERGLCDYDGYEDEYNCTDCDVPVNCPYYIATQALTPQECDVKECAIELKYAPRKCEYFCMGDCCLPDTNRSCGTDKDNCEYYNLYAQLIQLKAENEK